MLVLTDVPAAAAVSGAQGRSRVPDEVHHFQTSVQMIVPSCPLCQGCHTSFRLWFLLSVIKVLRECFIVAPHHSLGIAGHLSAGRQPVLEGELRPTKRLILKHLLWPLLVFWLHWWPPTPSVSALSAPGFLQPCRGEGGQVSVLQRCQQQWSAWLGLQTDEVKPVCVLIVCICLRVHFCADLESVSACWTPYRYV